MYKLVPHATKDWSRKASAPDCANDAITKKINESSSAVPGWTDTHCVLSYTRKGSSPKNAGSVKLINVLKLDVAQVSVSRRKCVLQCSDRSTTPGCDATHSLQARRQITRRATANWDSPHQKSVDATRNRPYCKLCCQLQQALQKGKSAVSMRSSEAADHFFVTVNQLQKKLQDDESVWRWAQLLHVFCQRKTWFARAFFTDHA